MFSRIMGLETEYGCLLSEAAPGETPERVSRRIKDAVFEKKLGLLDLHYRAHDEPPGNGGFLLNGGRIYLDMGHLEYATPECRCLADLVTYDRAGDRLLQAVVEELGLGGRVSIIKNNIDHYTGATFGSHENYLTARDLSLTPAVLSHMIAFLVTRQIFTGAGRVGGFRYPESRIFLESEVLERHNDSKVDYQISQRADYIMNDLYEWVQFNRAIINTRDEPLADPRRYRRIHLLVGDSNMLEYAAALKMGTTSVILSLIEEGVSPRGVSLSDAVGEMKRISRDPSWKWLVTLENGKRATAIDVQAEFLRAAQQHLKGRDEDTDWVIAEWDRTLEALAADPYRLVGKLDWISKRWILETFMEAERLNWDDPWLQSLDLAYHDLNPDRGLCLGLEEEGKAVRRSTDGAVDLAVDSPPRNTRAFGRAELVGGLLGLGDRPYIINWSAVHIDGKELFSLADPFKTYAPEAASYISDTPDV